VSDLRFDTVAEVKGEISMRRRAKLLLIAAAFALCAGQACTLMLPCDPSEPGTVEDLVAIGGADRFEGSPIPVTFSFQVTITNGSACRTVSGVRLDLREFQKASDLGLGDIDTSADFLAGSAVALASMAEGTNAIFGWYTTADASGEGVQFIVESPTMPADMGNIGPGESRSVDVVIRGTPYLVDGYVGAVVTTE
jgi:hypothetical protein